tara:strand:+ start:1895 stop:3181 length:1287 start_codon:yes stop_codon:yes gene_type:complete
MKDSNRIHARLDELAFLAPIAAALPAIAATAARVIPAAAAMAGRAAVAVGGTAARTAGGTAARTGGSTAAKSSIGQVAKDTAKDKAVSMAKGKAIDVGTDLAQRARDRLRPSSGEENQEDQYGRLAANVSYRTVNDIRNTLSEAAKKLLPVGFKFRPEAQVSQEKLSTTQGAKSPTNREARLDIQHDEDGNPIVGPKSRISAFLLRNARKNIKPADTPTEPAKATKKKAQEGVQREYRKIRSKKNPNKNYTKAEYKELRSQARGGKGAAGTEKDHEASDTTQTAAADKLETMKANRGRTQLKIAPSVKSTDQRKSAVAEGSGGKKRLARKLASLEKSRSKAIDREFDWKPRSGESGDDIVARNTVARQEGDAIHKKARATAYRKGVKSAEGEGRPSAREFGVGKYAPKKPTFRQSEIQKRVAANKEGK